MASAPASGAHGGGGTALVIARALLRRAHTMPTMASTPSTHTVPSAAPSAHVVPQLASAAAALEGAGVDAGKGKEGGDTATRGDGVGDDDDMSGARVCKTTAAGRSDGESDVTGRSVAGTGLVGRGVGELDLRDGVTGAGALVVAVGCADGCGVGASKTAHVGVHRPSAR